MGVTLPRRAALLAILAGPAWAQVPAAPGGPAPVPAAEALPDPGAAGDPPPEPVRGPTTARLRPDGRPWDLRVTADSIRRIVRLRVEGEGAPATEIVLPSRYGARPPIRALPLRGREVVLAEMPGVGGTGIAQTLVAVIALDDSGRLRVIGIENLDAVEAGVCTSDATFSTTFLGGETALEARYRFARARGACAAEWRGRPHSEAWTDRLVWDGRGVLSASTPAGAGPVRRRAAEARARVATLLARGVTDVRNIGLERTGLYDLPLHGVG